MATTPPDRKRDVVMVLASTWLMGGLFVDGYAHQNIDSTLETFFTPWHGLFYSGFTATAAWILWAVRNGRLAGFTGKSAIPKGYGLGVIGIAIFTVGGATDIAWHLNFGIELKIDALVSPPHLVIVMGVLLMITSPFRAAWSDNTYKPSTLVEFMPVLMSLTLAASLMSFMFMYLSALVAPDIGAPVNDFIARRFSGHDFDFVQTMTWRAGIASILISNLLLFAPVSMLTGRWRLPFGALTILITLITALMLSLFGFAAKELLAAALLGGLTVDVLHQRMHGHMGLRVIAFVGPTVFWSTYVAVIAIVDGLGWPFTLWTGAIFWAALSSLGLACLFFPKGNLQESGGFSSGVEPK